MVRIRMSRLGRPHRPFYRISAVDSRVKRDGAVIEQLGWYDPMVKEGKAFELKTDRLKYWLSVGAQPSETVSDLLAREGVIDSAPVKARREARATASKAAAEKRAAAGKTEEKKEG